MKIKKILTSIMSAAIVITSIGSIAINAEEATDTEEKVYKLSELFDMSKEEFFALGSQDTESLTPEDYYNNIKFG
ncbi:hypothetical protein, partial [Porcipelethomonas sp.]|uniref:hypothetical protein n=1 Tax=Porcipelethomonas sp. TaxID=2981675 RepID=UPI003EF56765